jgi:hypothetical protein
MLSLLPSCTRVLFSCRMDESVNRSSCYGVSLSSVRVVRVACQLAQLGEWDGQAGMVGLSQ